MTPHRARAPRLTRLLRGIGALAVLVAVVVGVPVLMVELNLVPHSVPSLYQLGRDLRERDDGQLAGVVLAAGVWICWALFTVSLIPELVAVARKKPSASLPGLGVFQRSAGALVTAIVIGFAIGPLITGAATAARRGPAAADPREHGECRLTGVRYATSPRWTQRHHYPAQRDRSRHRRPVQRRHR